MGSCFVNLVIYHNFLDSSLREKTADIQSFMNILQIASFTIKKSNLLTSFPPSEHSFWMMRSFKFHPSKNVCNCGEIRVYSSTQAKPVKTQVIMQLLP